MDKLISALNTIVENFDKITEIRKTGSVYAFRYLGKQTWAVQPESGIQVFAEPRGGYRVFYFPGDVTPDQAAEALELGYSEPERLSFSTSEIKTTEAYETFSDLYRQLGMKYFKIDNVLDEIIQTRQ